MGGSRKSEDRRGIIDPRLAFQGNTMSKLSTSSCIVLIGYLLFWFQTQPATQIQVTDTAAAKPAEVVLTDVKKQETSKPVEVVKPEVQQVVVTDCERLSLELQKYDWDSNVMFAIAQAENRTCDPAKHNETSSETHRDRLGNVICVGSYGALQVGCLHYGVGEDRNDLKTNVAVAYRLWSNRQLWGNGYEAWTMYLNGVYAQFL